MAWKYPVKDFQDGDIVSADDWNLNISHYVEEINGGMDRDNLPDSCVVVGSEVGASVFNTFSTKQINSPVTVSAIDSQSWVDTPLTKTDVAANTDTLLLVEASISWEIYPKKGTAFGYDDAISVNATQNDFSDHMRMEFQLVVDGFQVAYAGPHTRYLTKNNTFLCGALPVSIGSHEVRLLVRFYESSTYDQQTSGSSDLAKWTDQSDFYDSPFFRWMGGELIITKRTR